MSNWRSIWCIECSICSIERYCCHLRCSACCI